MQRIRTRLLPVVVLATSLAAPAASAAGEQPDGACAAPEHRQFDFWLGDWEVREPDGTLAGTNRIERILGGCVLHESWNGAGGTVGMSFNIFDPLDGSWHQTWVDSRGTRLELRGALKEGKMILSGETPSKQKPGTRVLQRITWEPRDKGAVRQLWEASRDEGTTWTVVFDGRYTRR